MQSTRGGSFEKLWHPLPIARNVDEGIYVHKALDPIFLTLWRVGGFKKMELRSHLSGGESFSSSQGIMLLHQGLHIFIKSSSSISGAFFIVQALCQGHDIKLAQWRPWDEHCICWGKFLLASQTQGARWKLAPKAKHNYWAKKKKENYKKTIPPWWGKNIKALKSGYIGT